MTSPSEEQAALGCEGFDGVWFTGHLPFLSGCHGLQTSHALCRLGLSVLLHDRVIPMATIDTAPGAGPDPAITRVQIQQVLFQH